MLEQKNNEEQNADGNSVSHPIAKPFVVCSLSSDNEVLEFGLKCYNDGLYDGLRNPKGGESITEKYSVFLKSINKGC